MAFLGWSLNAGGPGAPPTKYTTEPPPEWVENFIKAYLKALNLKLVDEREVVKAANSLNGNATGLKRIVYHHDLNT
ncbi:hypothetical protein SPFL3102_00466 [Sporomusaceae bacterium FL31]|nr:hypothetical protein SPFL3101_01606 [Sporomusaceae bacterium FL31]GCE32670.1 hypothetical protein SPFL3102_00466 [Sporomusaceae bacterium]